MSMVRMDTFEFAFHLQRLGMEHHDMCMAARAQNRGSFLCDCGVLAAAWRTARAARNEED
jgi:hypothetical protein